MVTSDPEPVAGEQKWLDKRYTFILNPHLALRCSTCPNCEAKTVTRKVALAGGVLKRSLVYFNMNGRYCRVCDILIVHKDRVEEMLLRLPPVPAEVLLRDYEVVGTIDGPTYQRSKAGKLTYDEVARQIRLFSRRLELHYTPAHWGPADDA